MEAIDLEWSSKTWRQKREIVKKALATLLLVGSPGVAISSTLADECRINRVFVWLWNVYYPCRLSIFEHESRIICAAKA